MDLDSPRPWAALNVALFAFVLLCFWPGLDNFLAGDDFNWVFFAAKGIARPSQFVVPTYSFVRHTELLFFAVMLLLQRWGVTAFQLGALLLHGGCAVLLSLLVARLGAGRVAALVTALFWALTYKHVEVVLRPYAVADSLALLFGLGAILLFLGKRPVLAAVCLTAALFSKENAMVFPVLITLHGLLALAREERRAWLARTIPLWGVTAAVAAIEAGVRRNAPDMVPISASGFTRFFEILLSYVGPDATWLRLVVLGSDRPLVPVWLAALLWVALGVTIWRLRGVPRFGLLWMTLFILPTVSFSHQSSRYHYVPLVGLWITLGYLLVRLGTALARRGRRLAVGTLVVAGGLLLLYSLVGIGLEEGDYALAGEQHREAVASFRAAVLPALFAEPEAMVVFLRPPPTLWLEPLYERSLLKPWYAPATYKWFYPRPNDILGQANTSGFVTFCAWDRLPCPLFASVPYPEFADRLPRGELVVVVHDEENRFHLGPPELTAELAAHPPDQELYTYLRPGRIDPTATGDPRL